MFVPLKSILPKAVGRVGLNIERRGFKEGDVCITYDKIITAIINKKAARNSRALFLRNGILTVEVPSSVWACQLQFVQYEVVRRINKILGKKIVERIAFRVR